MLKSKAISIQKTKITDSKDINSLLQLVNLQLPTNKMHTFTHTIMIILNQ
jgi:hypothetical protein